MALPHDCSNTICVCATAAMEGDGEVIISPVQNCSHCESGECHEIKDSIVCYCDDDLILARDGVSCINTTGLTRTALLHIHTYTLQDNL